MSNKLCTIVPPPSEAGKYTRTNGTKVVLPDGSVLGGVTSIRLIGHTNDIWRAEIECLAHVDAMPGMLVSINTNGKQLTLWQRTLLWLSGMRAIAVETLDSEAEYLEWRRFRLRRARDTEQA